MRNPFKRKRKVPAYLRAVVIDAAAGDELVIAYNEGFVEPDAFGGLAATLGERGVGLHVIPLFGDPAELLNLSVIRTA